MIPKTTLNSDLKIAKDWVYKKLGFVLTNLTQNIESIEYGACSFKLNDYTIIYRVSKITPTKAGQFVTIWKRNEKGKTIPFDLSDDFDFLIISVRNDHNFGQFIFPKSILAEKRIVTKNGKIGKRGIRVYPPWDKVANKQAMNTQSWQTKYFLTIKNENSTDFILGKQLFSNLN
jgi:hypothetical protein